MGRCVELAPVVVVVQVVAVEGHPVTWIQRKILKIIV